MPSAAAGSVRNVASERVDARVLFTCDVESHHVIGVIDNELEMGRSSVGFAEFVVI
jgi:hypothetical protein